MKILALKRKEQSVIPGFGLTFGISLTMLSILILIPLASILVYSFRLSPLEFWKLVTEKPVLNAFFTSIICSFIAAAVNCVFGVILAWVLIRYDFFGKRFLDGMLNCLLPCLLQLQESHFQKCILILGWLENILQKLG